MTRIFQAARTVGQGAAVAVADFSDFYTWRTWLGGWLVRMLCQVAFYSLIGLSVGDRDYVTYVVLGAALMVCVAESLMAVASTTWDQPLGTLPLLMCAPVQPGVFYFGRSLMWPLSGATTTSVAVFVMTGFFGINWTAAQVPMVLVLVLLTSIASYCMALAIACVAMVFPGARNVLSAVTTMVVTSFCGALVPVAYWPDAIEWFARLIPFTHGLQALRALQAGDVAAAVMAPAGLTAVIGVAWFVIAILGFRSLFAQERRGRGLLQ